MKRRVNVGEDFDLTVEIIEASTKHHRESTRSYLAKGFAVMAMLFLIGAAVYGLIVGQFGALRAIWDFVSLPLGWILCFYFHSTD